MNRDAISARFDDLNIWKHGDQRAPHKPLLLLYGLGRWQRGERAPISFQEAEAALVALLKEFGPPRQSHHPEYPFWRLQTDGVWLVESTGPTKPRKGNNNPPKSELLALDDAKLRENAL